MKCFFIIILSALALSATAVAGKPVITATNSTTHMSSLESATLEVSGFKMKRDVVAILFFAGGYELDTLRSVTDKKGTAAIPWTWIDCSTIPAYFGTPPYEAYFVVAEAYYSDSYTRTPTFTTC